MGVFEYDADSETVTMSRDTFNVLGSSALIAISAFRQGGKLDADDTKACANITRLAAMEMNGVNEIDVCCVDAAAEKMLDEIGAILDSEVQ